MKKETTDPQIRYSNEERSAFLESLKMYERFKNEIYRSKRLKEVSKHISAMIESAEVFTLNETDEWFDKVTVNRDLKELKNDQKLFVETCKEITQLQQRLESVYENIGMRLGRYYDI